MTDKLIEYRTCSSPNIAKRFIEHFENKYNTHYNWGLSCGDIEEAVAVCLLETERGFRYVTTTKVMSYIKRRRVVDIGSM